MEQQKEVFIKICINALDLQDINTGAMPPGHNGPYFDKQTPIRNTCHWAISFIKAYKLTQSDKFILAAKNCLDYICYRNEFRKEHTFIDRFKLGKDQENGTIGPAWNIEALIIGYRFFKDDNYLNLAKDLFYSLPFDENKGLWNRVTYDGKVSSVDKTYNHQLWFATIAYSLYNETNDIEIKRRVEVFLKKDYLRIRDDGVIRHSIYIFRDLKDSLKTLLRLAFHEIKKITLGKTMIYKEIGYHLFNIYAFSILKYEGCPLNLFYSNKLKKALIFSFSRDFFLSLNKDDHSKDATNLKITKELPFNRYGYAYNAPGFEAFFIWDTWKDMITPEVRPGIFWENQYTLTYNIDRSDFSNNTEDPITLTARLYELSRSL